MPYGLNPARQVGGLDQLRRDRFLCANRRDATRARAPGPFSSQSAAKKKNPPGNGGLSWERAYLGVPFLLWVEEESSGYPW